MIEEWPGQQSRNIVGGIKIVEKPIRQQSNVAALLGETSLGLERVKGKRHFEQGHSDVARGWRPCMKRIENPVQQRNNQTGLKRIDFKPKDSKPRPEAKHIQFPLSKTGEDYHVQSKMVMQGKKRYQDIASKEYDDHVKFIGRKIIVPTQQDKRNGLEWRAEGDKSYKKVEQSSDFYQEGGLVPGSSIQWRFKHQSRNATSSDFATVQSYDALNPPRKKWSERIQEERLREEQGDVDELIAWEKTILKESKPNYVDPDETDEED